MSGWYLDGKESLLARTIPSDAGVYVVGVNDEYVFNESDIDFSGITPHILLPEAQLSGVSFTHGVLRAETIKWSAAGAGIIGVSLVLKGLIFYFQKAGVGTLLAYGDSASAGLPQSVTGVDVTAAWDSRGILKL